MSRNYSYIVLINLSIFSFCNFSDYTYLVSLALSYSIKDLIRSSFWAIICLHASFYTTISLASSSQSSFFSSSCQVQSISIFFMTCYSFSLNLICSVLASLFFEDASAIFFCISSSPIFGDHIKGIYSQSFDATSAFKDSQITVRFLDWSF